MSMCWSTNDPEARLARVRIREQRARRMVDRLSAILFLENALLILYVVSKWMER